MSDLLAGSDRRQRRIMVLAGVLTVCVALACLLVVVRKPTSVAADTIRITVRTTYLGPGVRPDTQVLLRGVEVGRVESVRPRAAGGIDMAIRLRRSGIAGLTDTFDFDYRPQNYFGVTGVHLMPGLGGEPLSDGTRLTRTPRGDHTMSALLRRAGQLAGGTHTGELVEVVRRVADYTTALAPLLEAGILVTGLLAETQRGTPVELLDRLHAINGPLPDFVDHAISAETALRQIPSARAVLDDFAPMDVTMQLIATGFFGPVGALLGSHATDFTPLTEIVRTLSDVVTATLRKARAAVPLDTVLSGIDSAYTGPDGDKSLKLRIAVQALPFLDGALPGPGGR